MLSLALHKFNYLQIKACVNILISASGGTQCTCLSKHSDQRINRTCIVSVASRQKYSLINQLKASKIDVVGIHAETQHGDTRKRRGTLRT